MGHISRPRRGSLQYWPRKRARKLLPSINWNGIIKNNSSKKLMGFIGYKVGMASAFVKDLTNDSMTKNQSISIPVTIIACPSLKIFSVRFYKNKRVCGEILSQNLDKELKKILKLPKNYSKKIDSIKDYDDLRILAYSSVKKTGIKKTPDISEIALGGSLEDKINFIRQYFGKEINFSEFFDKMQIVDVKGVTKGKGIQGPIKRFGAKLRQHKSEKGVRKIGSLAPWHPARITFRTPMAGQMGLFTRPVYNIKIIDIGNIEDKNINFPGGFTNFGNIKTDYVILRGSVQGPAKRAVMITQPLRKTRAKEKLNYGFIELR